MTSLFSHCNPWHVRCGTTIDQICLITLHRSLVESQSFAAVVPFAWNAFPPNLCGSLLFIAKILASSLLPQKTYPDTRFKVTPQLLCISQDSSSVVITSQSNDS